MNDHGSNAGSWNEADACRKFVMPKLQAAGNSRLSPISANNLQLSKELYCNGGQMTDSNGTGAIGLKALGVTGRHTASALRLPRISVLSNVNEITRKFGGADQLRNADAQRQSLLYAA